MIFILFEIRKPLTEGRVNCTTACSESEYAAWTLVNGYSLNHTTVAAHHLHSELQDINMLNSYLIHRGMKMNAEGGLLKGIPVKCSPKNWSLDALCDGLCRCLCSLKGSLS